LLIIAAVVGIGLVTQGDSESGELSLPEPAKAEDVEQAPPSTSVESLQYLVTDGSEITFTVGEQLSRLPLPNDAVMRTDALSSQLNLDVQPSEISVNLVTLTSDQSFRDRYTQRTMFRDHLTAAFTVPALAGLPPEFLSVETPSRRLTESLASTASRLQCHLTWR